jgi:hypothetical protein
MWVQALPASNDTPLALPAVGSDEYRSGRVLAGLDQPHSPYNASVGSAVSLVHGECPDS